MGQDLDADVDILIVGAGVTGIYQLYLAREAGYSVQMVEQGTGVGGTWYWNRYPGSRYDSESYTYGYLFSEELFTEWEWTEHFAGQPENERYFNHVVDKFGLRQYIRFNTKVTSAVWDTESATWQVTAQDGYTARARYLVAATSVLSVPFYPNVPGRESFRGEAYHTRLWPDAEVDFKGKRVAVIGTGSSDVQVIPIVAPEASSVTVYQRTPNWVTPLNNRPITPEEQAELKADFEKIRDTVGKSPSGFLHQHSDKSTFEDSPEERQAFYERIWQLGGFGKIISNYRDMTLNPAANAEWSRFVADKIRVVVKDPATAEKLIPKDHGYAGKRPPYATDYFEAYNRPNVSLVDLNETPITTVTETGIAVSNQEGAEGLQEFDIIVWATGFDFGTGALRRLGVVGRDGVPPMTQSVGEHDIKVNVIAPNAWTRMAGDPSEGMDQLRGQRPPGAPPNLEPELVAPMVAFLAHESCPVSAGIYLAGGGRFARLFVASTDGYLHPDEVAPTPEDVAAHWAAINDEASYYVPTSTLNWSARYLSHRF